MPKYLPGKSRLTVISDTAMSGILGKPAAFEPVVREIDQLAPSFKSVDWLGYRWVSSSPANHKIPTSENIKMIGVHATGGNTFKNKISILTHLPGYLSRILYLIKNNNIVYTRGPSVPALLAILVSFFIKKKVYLHKYAGGWNLEHVPLFYALQRWLLKKQKRGHAIVSIALENDSGHTISLNNPCLTKDDIQNGFLAMKEKDYTNGFRICFAGQCVPTKGIFKLLDTINILADDTMFAGCTIVGNGDENELRSHLNHQANQITTFSGILSRQDLNQIYAESHFILLPSQSEGFPKVLAEAAAFGCVPITSNLPGFDKIIKNEVDGILLDDLSTENISEKLTVAWADQSKMKKIANQTHQWSKEFSYNFFIQNINTILGAS